MAEPAGGEIIGRAVIKDFPSDTITLILKARSEGWRVFRGSRNHVIMLAPDGKTRLTVSRNSGSAKYLSDDLRRYAKTSQPLREEPMLTAHSKFPCPRPGCNKTYVSLEALDHHTQVEHEKLLLCPDCRHTAKTVQALNTHRALRHGYESPEKGRKNRTAERRRLEALANEALAVPQEPAYPPLKVELPKVREAQPIPSPQPAAPPIDFIDDRNSWTISHENDQLHSMTISQLVGIYAAAGLSLEIRVWKDSV